MGRLWYLKGFAQKGFPVFVVIDWSDFKLRESILHLLLGGILRNGRHDSPDGIVQHGQRDGACASA